VRLRVRSRRGAGTATETSVTSAPGRHAAPQEWNIWDLERIAAASDAGQAEERTLLLVSLRQFAKASGELPAEFDSLVRDEFGAELAGQPLRGLG
jgi:hypothetical protein